MKILKIVQRHYAIMGICLSLQSTEKYPFNKRMLLGFLSFGYVIPSLYVYFLYVANGFMEHVMGICAISGTFLQSVGFATIVFKRHLVFECIDNLEKFIETSKALQIK